MLKKARRPSLAIKEDRRDGMFRDASPKELLRQLDDTHAGSARVCAADCFTSSRSLARAQSSLRLKALRNWF
jgi:hypothetical protein